MSSSIDAKKSRWHSCKWFVGLYLIGLLGYGVIELGLHYLNALLLRL